MDGRDAHEAALAKALQDVRVHLDGVLAAHVVVGAVRGQPHADAVGREHRLDGVDYLGEEADAVLRRLGAVPVVADDSISLFIDNNSNHNHNNIIIKTARDATTTRTGRRACWSASPGKS
jgi:hypothetical protein